MEQVAKQRDSVMATADLHHVLLADQATTPATCTTCAPSAGRRSSTLTGASRPMNVRLGGGLSSMILLHVAMSLDGFIAGPGHDMSWTGGAEYDTSGRLADEVARATGVVLAGRGWYEVASVDEGGAVAGIHGGAWSGPVLVLTHHPEQLASDRTVEAVSDLEIALARAEELAAGRAVSIFGADVARQVLSLGRLDEIIVQIVPVVLGPGCGCSARRPLLKPGWSARTPVPAGRSRTYAFEGWAAGKLDPARHQRRPRPRSATFAERARKSDASLAFRDSCCTRTRPHAPEAASPITPSGPRRRPRATIVTRRQMRKDVGSSYAGLKPWA